MLGLPGAPPPAPPPAVGAAPMKMAFFHGTDVVSGLNSMLFEVMIDGPSRTMPLAPLAAAPPLNVLLFGETVVLFALRLSTMSAAPIFWLKLPVGLAVLLNR